jgi:hypothetical protein
LLRCWQVKRGIIIDPITITGIAALDAALTGAGVGAVGGLVTGNDPLKGALLGGAVGGGGSLLGLGGGAAGGASQGITDLSNMVTPLETSLGTASEQLAPNAFGGVGIDLGNLGYNATEGSNLLGGMGTGITQTANPLMNMTAGGQLASSAPTLMDKLANAPSYVGNWASANPMSTAQLGLNAYDRLNQQPKPLQSSPSAGVNRGKGAVDYQPLLNIEVPKQKYPHSLLIG